MQIAKADGSGVDANGIRRLIFAGQPIPPGLEVDTKLVASEEEIGHLNPVTQGDHESEAAAANRDAVVEAQQHRSDIEGNLMQDPDLPVQRPGVGPESVDPEAAAADSGDEELSGEVLHERAKELDIKGRSRMNADELREAIAKAEAGEEDDE